MFKTIKQASCKQQILRSTCAFLFVSFYILLRFGIGSNECNASTFWSVNYYGILKKLSGHMASKRRCTGVDATSSRRINVSLTSFQRHVPAGGWMIRIRAQLVDPIQRQKRYIYSAQSRNRYNYGIVLRKVGILTLLRKVGILTLRKTIPELSLRKVRIGTK